MLKITPFLSCALKYKVIFFDAYGVLKNHKGIIPGIKESIRFLHKNGIKIFILTNDASRSPKHLADFYRRNGIIEITEEKVISSGMLAREYLRYKLKKGTVAYLGTENSAHYVEAIGLKTISIKELDIKQAQNIDALVLLDDEGFDWFQDLNKAINLLREKNMPVIVANTDITYPVSKQQVSLAIGGLGELIESVVRKTFIRFGKPDAQMFNFAYQHIQQYASVDKSEILMVGDSLNTDIIGGNKFGVDTALVLTGNTLPKEAELLINFTGIIPDYICASAVI